MAFFPDIDDAARAVGADRKKEPSMGDWFGTVVSTSPFKVAPLGSEVGLECTAVGSAAIGQTVYVIVRKNGHFVAICGGSGGSGGTTNYNELSNKPTITEPIYGTSEYSTVVLQGDKTFDELGMHPFSNAEINELIAIADAS